jgi:senataxin
MSIRLLTILDPNQLPPTVISQLAGVFSYEQSLFVRLQQSCPESVLLLDTQYRMHPDISRFPNAYFYKGLLVDGPGMEFANRRPWHHDRDLGPFRFFDVSGQEDSMRRASGIDSRSKMNEMEARCAASLVGLLCEAANGQPMAGRIGIVTAYKDQRRAISREISYRFGHSALQAIEISTVVRVQLRIFTS